MCNPIESVDNIRRYNADLNSSLYGLSSLFYDTDACNCLSGYANVNDRKNDNIMMLFCRFAILISKSLKV